MVLAVFNAQAQTAAGDAVVGVKVEVRRAIAGTPKRQVFADRAGATPLGNPFTTAVEANGKITFFAPGGFYNVRAFTDDGFEQTWEYIGIGTAQGFDIEDLDNVATIQNVDAGYALLFESEASAPPSPGSIRFNHNDLSQA